MKYKLDKQINEVAEGVHNKGRTSKSGFVGVVIRPPVLPLWTRSTN